MDKYQRVEKPRPDVPIMANEIRITSQGMPRNYIAYALTLMGERGLSTVVLKAMGNAISKAVTIAEVMKRRIPHLHENTEISSTPITYSWEPLEEGLSPKETTKYVSTITITLSTTQLDASSAGYQAPLPIDQVKALSQYNSDFVKGRGRGVERGSGIVACRNQHQNSYDGPGYVPSQGGGRGRGMRGQGRGRFGYDGNYNDNGFGRGRGRGQDNNYRGVGFGGRGSGRERAQGRGVRN